MADVFLSYSSADRGAAEAVQRALTAHGIDVFWDQEIPAGVDWDVWIRQKLSDAKLCVVLWSRRSIESRNVKHEAMIAGEDGKLMPVMLESFTARQMPMGLYLSQAATLRDKNPDSQDMQRVVAQVAARLQMPAPKPRKRKSNLPPLIAGATAVAIAAAAIVAWQLGVFGRTSPAGQPDLAAVASLERTAPPPVTPQPAPRPAHKDFETLKHCDECPSVIVLPAGEFAMGSDPGEVGAGDNEFPKRTVSVRQFAIGLTEVTFDEWEACERDGPCMICEVQTDDICTKHKRLKDFGFGRGTLPVMYVSWDMTQLYLQWLSSKTGKPYRLPTEAEWEYAAWAGGRHGQFFWSGDPLAACDKGNTYDVSSFKRFKWTKQAHVPCDDGFEGTAPVKSFPPNAWNLYDMFANISEWVQDCYAPDYLNAPADGSAWEAPDCRERVVRGGSWWGRPDWARITYRMPDGHDFGDGGMGFRVAMDTTN